MGEIIRTYDAFRTLQTAEGKPLILFAAPAVEIDEWVGVPQRRRLAGEETSGFQREVDDRRLRELTDFFDDPHNVAQNPLLAALQDSERIEFKELHPGSPFGTLTIAYEDYSRVPLLELLERLTKRLESRVNSLNADVLDESRISEIMQKASEEADPEKSTADEEGSEHFGEDFINELFNGDEDGEDKSTVLLADETRIVEFYTELKGRIRAMERLELEDADHILGFSREAILGYLKPVVLVDGQHRLRGAVESAYNSALMPEGQTGILDAMQTEDISAEEAERKVVLDKSRNLPVSLLMDQSPSEHVFQFVVVNQKAVPMGNALLGTIVSTSLSKDELHQVAKRLQRAGIELESSQSVAYLTRAEESPFRNLVQTGMSGDRPDLLKWSVLQSLATIFRKLQGARLKTDEVDYARAWRKDFLPDCELASGDTAATKFEDWQRPDGPWRDVFVRFFTKVRDYFGDAQNPDSHNGWGSTAKSNLYNKISLTILACDFFDHLYTREETLPTLEALDEAFASWVKNGRVSQGYFNRDWKLDGVKKDQRAVKELWAKNWHNYRKVPSGIPNKFKP